MRKKWELLRRWVDDRFDNRVTTLGTLFAVLTVSVGAAAMISANNLLFLILAALLGTILISGVVNRLTLAGLEMEFLLPEHLAARMPGSATIRVHNHKSWWPSFSLLLEARGQSGFLKPFYYPYLPCKSSQEVKVEVLFPKRGRYTENNFRFSTRFPFGFAERRTSVSLKGEILVYPNVQPKAGFMNLAAELSGEAAQRERGRGTDFHSLRPYQHGEGARHLDWKGTAHTGQLQIREFAREQRHLLELVLDTDCVGHEDWFEWAVECVAWLSVELTTRGWPVRFRSNGADIIASSPLVAYDILKFLADVEPKAMPLPKPDEHTSIPILFTARAHGLADLGWRGVRFIRPDDWPGGSTNSNPDSSSQ